MTDRMEPVLGEAGTFSGINVDWLFKSQGFGITRWDCSHGRREMSDEKCQPWHVIGFVHSGAFVLHAQGKSALIDSTAVLLYNPEEPYRSEHPYGCCDHGSAIAVRQETLLDVLVHHDPAAEARAEAMFLSAYAHGLSRPYLLQRLLLQSLRSNGPREPMAVEAAVLRILGEVARGCSRLNGKPARRRDPDRARRDYVEDAKALLQRRFQENLRLEDLGQALHVSTYHLCRLFKEQTGMPIHRYLNQLRLRQALEAIAAGEEDLCGLALSLGFSSHSHFTTSFRKEFGISPREARGPLVPGGSARL
ncbi:MAG TPA: AraC family transcriptional regulator [Thermoanaerobaculia bacterium]|nr:AraC family transcriptional regulator [Thermoanaerobaculia bacterium]